MKTPIRQWLAPLPLLAVFLITFSVFDFADRLPAWAGLLFGVSLGIVSVQWGRVAEAARRKPHADA